MYVAGFERGVRPIGDWSMAIILSRCSSPSMPLVGAGIAEAAVQVAAQGLDQDVVHQRALARAGNAGDAHEHAQRDLDVDVLEVVVRAPRTTQLRLADRPARWPGLRSAAGRKGTAR